MQVSSERPVPILPMSKHRPVGVPIGSRAFVLKMTPEALEQLSAQLAVQQPATALGSQASKSSNSRNLSEKPKKNEKPLMQLIVGDGGQPQFVIGGHTFRADAVNEQYPCEIYARHQSPLADSDQPATEPSGSNQLQMVAKVDGRLQIKREYDSRIQQSVTERTARMNKEAQPRSAIILDAPVVPSGGLAKNIISGHHNKQPSVAQAAMPPSTAASRPNDPKGQAALTPPKSDGSPSSILSGPPGLKHQIPDAFATLDLNVPTRWDGNVPTPIRLIHLVALSPKTDEELLTVAGLAGVAERKEGLRALNILSQKQSDGKMKLRDAAYYYLRPWCWVHYSPKNRAQISKDMRMALRRLEYNDQFDVWSHVTQANGWVDPWKSTPEGMQHYREKEQKKAENEAAAKEDHKKMMADALANPAPMLTSSIKKGFFSSNPVPAKGNKQSKEKDPKVKKEKSSGKGGASEKESVTHPKIAPSTSQASSSGINAAAIATEPTVLETELRIRKSGPGSAGGKLAVAKRFQREKEEGLGSTVTTPTFSPRPLPSASTSKNTTPNVTKESRKRKVEDDYEGDHSIKKKKTVVQARAPAPAPTPVGLAAARGEKRKGDDIGSLSPPLKIRKGEGKSSTVTHAHTASASSTQERTSEGGVKSATATRKDKTSATGDFNRKKSRDQATWDYSSDEDSSTPSRNLQPSGNRMAGRGKGRALAPPHRGSASGLGANRNSRSLLAPHPVAPPTNYLGFKAVFFQKLAEYEMVRGILLGEEAKLANARVGDSSEALMGVADLRALMRKRDGLQTELKEVKAEIARLNGIARSGTSSSR